MKNATCEIFLDLKSIKIFLTYKQHYWKETWTKPKAGRVKGGRWEWLGCRGVVRGKKKQLYLNNNKKNVGGK